MRPLTTPTAPALPSCIFDGAALTAAATKSGATPVMLPTLSTTRDQLWAHTSVDGAPPQGVSSEAWAALRKGIQDWESIVRAGMPWVAEELGAPLGPQRQRPSRVCRNWGVLLRKDPQKRLGKDGEGLAEPQTEEPGELPCAGGVPDSGPSQITAIKALGVAQARVRSFWQPAPEGWFLVLKVEAPVYFGLLGSLDFLAREQLEARCLQQMTALVQDLVAHTPQAHQAAAPEVEFLGHWDEATVRMQQKIYRTAVLAWAALHRPPTPLVNQRGPFADYSPERSPNLEKLTREIAIT